MFDARVALASLPVPSSLITSPNASLTGFEMPHTRIVYASTNGQTQRIAERQQNFLRRRAVEATLAEMEGARQFDPADGDCLIAGACVRHGRHEARMARFLANNKTTIERMAHAQDATGAEVAAKPKSNGNVADATSET